MRTVESRIKDRTIIEDTLNYSRLEQLKALRLVLARTIDQCNAFREMAALSKRFMEVTAEIEAIEPTEAPDEISELLKRRAEEGCKPVRAARHRYYASEENDE